eukprot:scaffold19280_cov46-Phaeocystis_antarctica.AAC.3
MIPLRRSKQAAAAHGTVARTQGTQSTGKCVFGVTAGTCSEFDEGRRQPATAVHRHGSRHADRGGDRASGLGRQGQGDLPTTAHARTQSIYLGSPHHKPAPPPRTATACRAALGSQPSPPPPMRTQRGPASLTCHQPPASGPTPG